jgi:hypothetical protein
MDKPAQWALVGAAWFLALTVAVIGFLAWRHFEAISGPLAVAGTAAPLQDGATAICPVTKERIVIAKDTPQLVYKERVFYFSKTLDAAGREPKRLFLMDPEFYANPGTPPLAERIPTPVPETVNPAPTVAPFSVGQASGLPLSPAASR